MILLMQQLMRKLLDENKLNITFKIEESEKFYVERINILGNHITQNNLYVINL